MAARIGAWYVAIVHERVTSRTGANAMREPSFAEILEVSTARCRAMDAPLEVRLAAFADVVRELSPEFTAIVERMVLRLVESGAGLAAPDIGEPMPSFLLPDHNGHLISLERLLENGPLAIAMHRGHWCPYCRISASALAATSDAVRACGGQIVAITPELQIFNSRLRDDAAASYPVLTDLDNAYALETNVAIWVGEEKKQAMSAAGWDISRFHGNDAWILPIPATFVVGTDGLVKARYVNPDYRTRMPIEPILAALKDA